jgi:uncharacterized protein YjiS (DUF1127 family)
MSGISTLALGSSKGIWRARRALSDDAKSGLDGPATRGDLVTAWRKRIRLRWHLARLSKDGPELIEDIGLTMAQVEAELKRPFWRR